MRRMTTILMVLLLAGGSLLPLATANWKFRGTNEPDTTYDEQDGYMFPDPDVDPDASVRQVYFNGFAHVAQVWINPNSAALGSRLQPGNEISLSALLGVWKDCNNDGYIGFGDQGLFEYRTALLLNDDICPANPVTDLRNPPSPYPYNDGAWVREFLWIGSGANPAVNPTVITVTGNKVWFDWGAPGDPPRTTCPTTGAISFRSTGALVEWSDCLTGYRAIRTMNDVESASGGAVPVGRWDLSDPENSNNDLNMQNPLWTPLYGADGDGFVEGSFGRDHRPSGERAERAVTVWDCSDNANPQLNDDPEVNPDGSVYEPVNETYNIVTKADTDSRTLGPCKQEGAGDSVNEAPWPALDGESEPQTSETGKTRANDHFIFSYGNRRHLGGGGGPLGPFAPVDGGTAIERDLDAIGSSWRSNTLWGADPQFISRGSLEPTPATYLTFYAKLGSTNFALPATAQTESSYGSETCGTATSGILGGWNCDAQKWRDRCGTDDIDGQRCVLIGEGYHMRDVDCWDGRLVAGVDAYASLVALTDGGPCQGGATTIDP